MYYDCQTMPTHIVDAIFREILASKRLDDVYYNSQKIVDIYGGWEDDPQ